MHNHAFFAFPPRRLSTLCLAIAGGLLPPHGAIADDPPIRTGLWEQHQVQTLNGADMQMPQMLIDQARQAGVDMAGNGDSERLCITRDNIATIGQPDDDALPACHKENVQLTKKGMSLRLVCADDTGSGQGTVQATFDSPTYYHGRFDFTGTHQLFGDNQLPLTIAGQFTGHWLGPNCPPPR